MKKNNNDVFSRSQIAKIAIAYSNGSYDYHNFMEEYVGFSQNTFYTLLHIAVKKAIVSEEVAHRIQQTAVKNSIQNAKQKGYSTTYIARIEHKVFNSWENYIQKAKEFNFSKKEAISLVEQYSTSNLSAYEFCEVNCIDIKLFNRTVLYAIIYSWVNADCFDRLYKKALMEYKNSEQAEHLFWQLTKSRILNKTSKYIQ